MRGGANVCQIIKTESVQIKIKPKQVIKVKAASINSEEKKSLLLKHLSWVKFLANNIAMQLPPSISVDDLISAGNEGLLKVIDKFDPSKNIQFKTYAKLRIVGAILQELRIMDWTSRPIREKRRDIKQAIIAAERELNESANDLDIAEQLGINLDDYYNTLKKVQRIEFLSLDEYPYFNKDGEDVFEPIKLIIAKEYKEIITKVIESLPEKEPEVIYLYYFEELTFKEVGKIMELTEGRISQIHAKAIIRLKKRLRKY